MCLFLAGSVFFMPSSLALWFTKLSFLHVQTAQTSGAKVVDTVEHVSYAPLLSVEAASTLLPQATMTAPPNLHLLRSFGMLGQPMPASAHANASSAPRAYEAATVTPSSVGSPQQAHAQGGPAASYTGYFGDMSFKDATTPQSMEARPSDVRALPAPMAPPVLPSPHMSSSTHSSSAAGTASPPVMNSSRLGVVSVDLPPAYSPERTTDDDADDAPSLTLTAPKYVPPHECITGGHLNLLDFAAVKAACVRRTGAANMQGALKCSPRMQPRVCLMI